MSRVLKRWSTIQEIGRLRQKTGQCASRCLFYSGSVVQENDIVLLRKKGSDNKADPILTSPLDQTDKIITPRGHIDKASLIGKAVRDTVTTTKGVDYRIHQPTLGEYVRYSPRKVTPIYPQDAELIVSLLDLHPGTHMHDQAKEEPMEIFEAGTGHGSLTLHLARAIHGANPPAPALPPVLPKVKKLSLLESFTDADTEVPLSSTIPVINDENNPLKGEGYLVTKDAYQAYLRTRRAIIQTLDISPIYSAHAQTTVRNFRQGLYYSDINFHTGTIPEYISSRLAEHASPFLAHAFLDLPSPQTYFEIISQALQPNGILLVFCPSITQIIKCVQTVKAQFLPFMLETAVELGGSGGSAGREWDIRFVKPRAVVKTQAKILTRTADIEESQDIETDGAGEGVRCMGSLDLIADSEWETVCRPKVGIRVTGGGFLGLFRRMAKRPKL